MRQALTLARRGWRVFPCHTPQFTGCACGRDGRCPRLGLEGHRPTSAVCSCWAGVACQDIGKHPHYHPALIPHGLKNATTDVDRIITWWTLWPDANIGLATGVESGIIALDVDPAHGGESSLSALLADIGPLPKTTISLTGGGGRHILFQHPGDGVKIGNAVNLQGREGLDVRGDGGYLIAPRSRHASGRHYTWAEDGHPREVPPAPVPAPLLRLVTASKESPAHASTQPSATTPAPDGAPIPKGQRNQTLASLAGTMRRRGMTEKDSPHVRIQVAGLLVCLRGAEGFDEARQCVGHIPEGGYSQRTTAVLVQRIVKQLIDRKQRALTRQQRMTEMTQRHPPLAALVRRGHLSHATRL